MSILGGVRDTADGLLGSFDESFPRQFDDVQGGGFVDEAAAVLDPRRAASAQTEGDIQLFGAGTPFAFWSALTSGTSLLDDDVGGASGAAGDALEDLLDALSELLDGLPDLPGLPAIGAVLVGLVALVVVWVLGQLFEIQIGG